MVDKRLARLYEVLTEGGEADGYTKQDADGAVQVKLNTHYGVVIRLVLHQDFDHYEPGHEEIDWRI